MSLNLDLNLEGLFDAPDPKKELAPVFSRSYGVGPKNCKIAFVGEAPGKTEEEKGVPFVGASGKLLTELMSAAGIERSECFISNVFKTRPYKNKIEQFFETKTGAKSAGVQIMTGLDPIRSGSSNKFLLAKMYDEVSALKEELTECTANVIVPLGGTATWALTGINTISKMRGYVDSWTDLDGKVRKILPTVHPAAVLRMWSFRPLAIIDLMKAKREAEFPEINYIQRTVYIPETAAEFEDLVNAHLRNASIISLDVETARGQITRISFSPDPELAICVPFWDKRNEGWSYWKSIHDEIKVRKLIMEILRSPIPKLGQNGLYDIQYNLQESIPIFNYAEDTMLLHYALMPEMPKDLGTLGSIHTDEMRWKDLRNKQYTETKRDD